ncbi:hypothetical protein MA16_Dca019049 [Dendrobium catenatum]|uniref:Uncharacterized protein n=1 Tax=Dendrobium catenatum TaxID=906689 RepID=A0A2I0VHY9_9ASPA|nr:hypothetical protein MA16_Dca019049 [Dendrobium catenatum]
MPSHFKDIGEQRPKLCEEFAGSHASPATSAGFHAGFTDFCYFCFFVQRIGVWLLIAKAVDF